MEGRALSPRILELRGRLAAAVGDAPSSDRTLREALDLYGAIGATGHAERLTRELEFMEYQPTSLEERRLTTARADLPATHPHDRILMGGGTMHRRPTRIVREAILAALVLCGCATVAPVNVPVGRAEPEAGYRIAKLLGRHRGPANNPDALVFLAFFGGGPRAVALSYGVLEELRRTPIMVKGHPHSMLDEVDLVAGVSGGSFTALAYALYGERLFDEYPDRFLKRNVQGELIQ
jgi:hypothetical protein